MLTFKEGLLSAVAHDLELRVTRFTLEVDDESRAVQARFEAASLVVVSAMQDGAPRPGLVSESDRHKIESNAREDVLEVGRYPEIRFASKTVSREGDGYRIAGELTLHGRSRPVEVTTRREGDRQVAELRLDQREFGIKPYSAMLGALKIKPYVTVRLSAPG